MALTLALDRKMAAVASLAQSAGHGSQRHPCVAVRRRLSDLRDLLLNLLRNAASVLPRASVGRGCKADGPRRGRWS